MIRAPTTACANQTPRCSSPSNSFSSSSSSLSPVAREPSTFLHPSAALPKSPWGVQLRKAKTGPVPRKVVGGDWTDPHKNWLLADFVVPSTQKSARCWSPPRKQQQPTGQQLPHSEDNVKEQSVVEGDVPPPKSTLQPQKVLLPNQDSSSSQHSGNMAEQMHPTPAMNSNEPENSPENKSTSTIEGVKKAPKQGRKTSKKSKIVMVPNKPKTKAKAKKSKTTKTKPSSPKPSSSKSNALQLQVKALEDRLAAIRQQTETDIENIRRSVAEEKQSLHDSLRKQSSSNKENGDTSRILKNNRKAIAELKKQNAIIREQNKQLQDNITSLRVNNDRLQAAQLDTTSCAGQLQFHHDMCVTENAKLNKIVQQCRAAVEEHEEQLELCNAHLTAEQRIKSRYQTTMEETLAMVQKNEQAAGDDLFVDLRSMMNVLEESA